MHPMHPKKQTDIARHVLVAADALWVRPMNFHVILVPKIHRKL